MYRRHRMLTDIPRDMALTILELLMTGDRVKLAVQSKAWRDLALAKSSKAHVKVDESDSTSRFNGMVQWLTDRSMNVSVASNLQLLRFSTSHSRTRRGGAISSVSICPYSFPGKAQHRTLYPTSHPDEGLWLTQHIWHLLVTMKKYELLLQRIMLADSGYLRLSESMHSSFQRDFILTSCRDDALGQINIIWVFIYNCSDVHRSDPRLKGRWYQISWMYSTKFDAVADLPFLQGFTKLRELCLFKDNGNRHDQDLGMILRSQTVHHLTALGSLTSLVRSHSWSSTSSPICQLGVQNSHLDLTALAANGRSIVSISRGSDEDQHQKQNQIHDHNQYIDHNQKKILIYWERKAKNVLEKKTIGFRVAYAGASDEYFMWAWNLHVHECLPYRDL